MPKVADVYVTSNRPQRVIQTTPGRRVEIRGGHGVVFREEDMPHMLRISDAVIVVAPEKIDWIPDWVAACGEHNRPVAKVEFPDGTQLLPPYSWERPAAEEPPKRRGRPPKGGWAVTDEQDSADTDS